MLQLTAISSNESWSLDRWHHFTLALLVFTFSKLCKQHLPGHHAPVLICQKRDISLQCVTTVYFTQTKTRLTAFYYLCTQGSYWAIDTNPKEDALPTRPKKRPRSGERVSIWVASHGFFFWQHLGWNWSANHLRISVCLPSFISHT